MGVHFGVDEGPSFEDFEAGLYGFDSNVLLDRLDTVVWVWTRRYMPRSGRVCVEKHIIPKTGERIQRLGQKLLLQKSVQECDQYCTESGVGDVMRTSSGALITGEPIFIPVF